MELLPTVGGASIEKFAKAPGYSMRAKKAWDGKREGTPGPGAYNANEYSTVGSNSIEKFSKSPGYSMRPKSAQASSRRDAPGPGAYNTGHYRGVGAGSSDQCMGRAPTY